MWVSKGYEAGGDKKCKNSPESCVSGELKCERAGEWRRDRAAEGGGESECESVVSALYIALPVCTRLSFPVFSLSLSLIHAHGNTQTRTHRPREGEWESERENTSQPRCSRRFFEVRCLVCLPSGEWEWEGETFSSYLSLCLHLFLLLAFLCYSHIISMLFWFCVDTRNECACGFVCALIKACLPYPLLLWLNHAVLFQGWWVAPRLKYNQNKASDFFCVLLS